MHARTGAFVSLGIEGAKNVPQRYLEVPTPWKTTRPRVARRIFLLNNAQLQARLRPALPLVTRMFLLGQAGERPDNDDDGNVLYDEDDAGNATRAEGGRSQASSMRPGK